jgi:GR25 family glycosyltransferase involved in LPS biosynthesis
MRIGVLGKFQFSMFSGSQSNCTLSVAEIFKLQGHSTFLINANERQPWWDDVVSLKEEWKDSIRHLKDLSGERFDVVFEVGEILEAAQRTAICDKSIVVLRKHAVLDEIERCLFPTSSSIRSFERVSEIWLLDQHATADDVQLIETISRLPVRVVPYVWTPSIIEKHRAETQSPVWLQACPGENRDTVPWSVHIAETNTSSSSSCTLPVLIMKEQRQRKIMDVSRFRIHNAEHVYKSKFFQDNVWKHARVNDISGEFIGRQRSVDWVHEPMSCMISHVRFMPFRPIHLDLAWVGVPFVHNSLFIRDLGHGLERLYYRDNRITEACDALRNMKEDFVGSKGIFTLESLNAIRQELLMKISPMSQDVQKGWQEAFAHFRLSPLPPLPPSPPPVEEKALPLVEKKSKLVVGFSDMWDQFNPSYNFFTLMLEEATKHLTPALEIQGVAISAGSAAPDVLFFGPFGQTWKSFADVPKIHFTGENSAPVEGPNVFLNLGFMHKDMSDDTYLRFPLWILEIDWFGADPERIQNPKPIPIDRCTKVFPEELERKKKFCAFVVSNPNNPVRNSAFHWLSMYKGVDSGGALFNNIGPALAAGPGGGGGELKKFEFFKNYKFAITYENNSSPGYCTEKLLHAKAAGCIPIYWGDPKINRDFDTGGFISAQQVSSPKELIDLVSKVDTDDELWKKMASVPALDEYKRDWTRRTISECARRVLTRVIKEPIQIPKFLGATETVKRKGLQPPVVVTYATRRFLPSLQLFLTALAAQKKQIPELKVIVYYGEDVPSEAIKNSLESFDFLEERHVPSEASASFPDLWEAQHFAWKLWICNQLVNESTLDGSLIFYMDSGCFLSRWPTPWLRAAQDEEMCVLEDPRQDNAHWCHDAFMKALAVTEDEKKEKQIWAGAMIFRAGAPKVIRLFKEAWVYGQMRDVIVGEKWSGAAADGKPFGHRHDQSILSILTSRYKVKRLALDDFYCDKSLRNTFQGGYSIYCHRGNFRVVLPFSLGIDDCYVINLDRREDRMKKLFSNSPDLETRITRVSAIEGKKLVLTPELARLFRPHDFLWKKAIMGCALSHLSLWWKLATEHQEVNSFLILEDDAKLSPEWEGRWKQAQPHLPEDWDVIYLGGILPPNRAGFEMAKEKVNPYFSRVAANSFFGQNPPNRYFHWCAYAYVLSKKGAQKILEVLRAHDGYWTSADHMICNPVNVMNLYFLDPLVAGCYQDDDPVYRESAFNNFNRVDKFDSDLWNNDERFAEAERDANLKASDEKDFDIPLVLQQVKQMNSVVSVTAPSATVAAQSVAVPVQSVAVPVKMLARRFVCYEQHNLDLAELHEKDWLLELSGKTAIFEIDKVTLEQDPPKDSPIMIVQRPWSAICGKILQKWSLAGCSFSILHLSDEHLTDDLRMYDLAGCKSIVRMYDRADLTEEQRAKTLIIPLGYHWALGRGGGESPLMKTPRLPFRSHVWSFFGTAWRQRDEKLQPLQRLQPHRLSLLTSWNGPNSVGRDEYLSTLLDTVFVPCPGGQNAETYRFYEALECGCVPIVVKEENDSLFTKMIMANMEFLAVSSWQEAAVLIAQLMENKTLLENYRANLLIAWQRWKERLVAEFKKKLELV